MSAGWPTRSSPVPRRTASSILAVVVCTVIVALVALPTGASAYIAQLKRYPYLTDVVGSSATINWGTDRSSINGAVKWGKVGTESCTAHTTAGTRTAITVNGVSEYQWRASLSGLAADSQYCYRVYFGSGFTIDLLGTDSSPTFRTQLPQGATTPFSFAVFGDWGKVDSTGQNSDQANVMSQLAQSGTRFAVTTGDNAYDVGSQKDYGDLYQVGSNTSAVFGPSFWKVPGASIPAFPVLGNHDHNNSVMLTNWPQDTAATTSGGRYTTETYCCLNGTQSTAYPSAWYAFDAGVARFYVLDAAWDDSNSGTADVYQDDYDYHWTPSSDEYQWLANDLATHPRQLKFAFWHFPMYSDNQGEGSDPNLQGANSLEGLLKLYNVTLGFSGHAHSYQRFSAPSGGIPTYATGGGGATLDSIGTEGCNPLDAYALGWNTTNSVGSACGAASIPTAKDQVHHFLVVNVNGSMVTVTPTDELGRTFDPVTYNVPPSNADLSLQQTDSPDPVLAGQTLTYTLTVQNQGPSTAIGTQLTDNLPAGVTFVAATPSQGSCSQASGTVSCALGTIASGAGATVDVEVTPQSAGSVSNTASVSSSVSDPNSANNSATASTTVNPAADLSLQKTDSPDPLLVGQELTYTLTAHNAGPSTATGVQITDNLPAGVTFSSATPSQGSCSQSSGTVTCALGTLASGANATVTVKVVPQDSGSVTNQASVGSSIADPDPSNNSASADTTVNPAAGLSLSKTDAPDPVLVGQLLTYALTARNAGPLSATGVQVTDSLPGGVTFDSATPSQGSCGQSNGTVVCAIGTVSSGQSATVDIKVRPQATGSITNQATVTSAVFDPDVSDNSASADTTVIPAADLSLQKTDSPDPVLAGHQLTYTLTAHNAGPSTAIDVQVTDNLPASVTFESANPSQGSCSEASGTVSCTLGTIASGADATVDVEVTRDTAGTITNQATVGSDVADPDSSNNSASATTTVNPAADLALTKTDEPDPVLVGQPLNYTLEVVNTGPQGAGNVMLSDALPASVAFNSATPSQGSCSQSSGTVTCALGQIVNGQSASVEVNVTPQSPGTLTNQANVLSIVADPDAANNSASADTTVIPAADLSLQKTASPDPIAAGQQLTYTLTAHNAGPSSATNVQVTDNLPASVTFDSATPSQGSCSQSSGTVSCALGTLASGASASVDVKVRPQSPGSITNSASVSSDVADPRLADNSASADTTVNMIADLSLQKTDAPDPVLAGQQLTYTLTAHNAGPSSATNVQVTDNMPASVTFDSATPSQGSCSQSSGTVSCALGTLASGGNATIDVKVRPQSPGSITNSASVSSDGTDPNSADNSASTDTTVTPAADLSLQKTDSPDPVFDRQQLTYTLTAHNAGPSSATNVQVTDNLPASVTFDSATPSQGSCSQSSGMVSCALGTLALGASASVDVKVRPQSPGSITNSASVSSDVTDPSSTNNSASADTTVIPAADLSLQKTDSPDPIAAGQQLTYTLTAHNAGPSSATNVQVTDNLPASVTFDSATPSQGSCSQSSGTVSCALGTLASGADATVTVKVHPQTESTITNSASVGSDAFDANSADNSASAATTVASPSYVRPRGATPIYMSLVPAYRQCTASNRTHGPSLSQPSCTPPVQSSSALTLGTPDANGSLANGGGSVRLIALINPAPAPNDVSISVNLTDVRCQTGVVACGATNATDGPDYTGELQATYSLRLTDRANDPTSTTPGTVTDTTFPVTVPCAASTSTTIGSSCSLSTSANSVAPGSVRRGDRAIWQVGRVEVDDGGPDGLIATADNSVFEVQGLFVP